MSPCVEENHRTMEQWKCRDVQMYTIREVSTPVDRGRGRELAVPSYPYQNFASGPKVRQDSGTGRFALG